jgi:hypothetical protein
LLDDAFDQLGTLGGRRFELRTAPNLMALKSAISWREKIAMLWKRVFVPHAELARLYGLPAQSVWINLYYAVRLRDLVLRYAASARELNASGPQIAASAERHARLAKWIAGG